MKFEVTPPAILEREMKTWTLNFTVFSMIVPVVILFLKSDFIQIFFQTKYSGSLTGDVVDDGVFFLLNFLVSIGLAIASIDLFKNRKFSFFNAIYFFISVFLILALIILGDRNLFLYHVMIFLGAFATYYRTLPPKMLFFAIVIGYVFYQSIEIFRENRDSSIVELVDTFENNDNSNSFVEGSFAITTTGLRATFSAVDEVGFFYGKFKLIGIAGVIPFSRGFIVSEKDYFTTSSKVLKSEMIGKNATWGVGSNIISDIFFDFGVVGVVFFTILLGAFSKYVEIQTRAHSNLKWDVMYLLTLSLYTQIPRYTFDFPIRNIVWAFVVFSVASVISRLKIR